MRRRRRSPEPPKGAPSWMVTFSDLVTLILVFFILLFSMSQIDLMKFQAISDSFRDRQVLDFQPSIVPAENQGEMEEKRKRRKTAGNQIHLISSRWKFSRFLMRMD